MHGGSSLGDVHSHRLIHPALAHCSVRVELLARPLAWSVFTTLAHESRLTFVPDLPDQVDPASTNQTSAIAIDEPLQMGQVRGDTEAARHHQDRLVLVHGNTCSMRPAKHDETIHGTTFLSMMQQLSGDPSLRLDKKIDSVLLPWRPGDHHERMTLGEGPEADKGHPQVDMLSIVNLQRLLKVHADLDRTIVVRDGGSRKAVAEDTILVNDAAAL